MSNAKEIAKCLGMKYNVSIRVIDEPTGKVVSEHMGHNASTNSLLTGVAHYLVGDGVLNQGEILSTWVPRYISLGTMGLLNQEEDEEGLPAGIGAVSGTEEERFISYMKQNPGFGADGYDSRLNNNRAYFGLGPAFADRSDVSKTINCELVSTTYPRASISYREIVPELQAEYPQTIDVVLSALISTGALAQFREPGKDYIFITEAGLWSRSDWIDSGDNGLLAGYRIAPPDDSNWAMQASDVSDEVVYKYLVDNNIIATDGDPIKDEHEQAVKDAREAIAKNNRKILKQNIIKIGPNQVAQIIWKIQLGAVAQFGGRTSLYPSYSPVMWVEW